MKRKARKLTLDGKSLRKLTLDRESLCNLAGARIPFNIDDNSQACPPDDPRTGLGCNTYQCSFYLCP